MRRKIILPFVVLLSILFGALFVSAGGRMGYSYIDTSEDAMLLTPQRGGGSERRMVDMVADDSYLIDHGDSTVFILVGNFAAHHNGAVITADSAVRYSNQSFECFGNVLINQNTTYIYGDRAEYSHHTGKATIYSDLIKVVDGDAVMYTYNCTFDTEGEMGEFHGGCYVLKGESLMESERGYYNTATHDLIAVDRVEMRDEVYQMKGDSVIFNTETEDAKYFRNTNIWNDKDEYLFANQGTYTKSRDLHHLTRDAYLLSPEREVWSDSIEYYRTEGHIIGRNNIQIDDTTQKIIGFADYGEWWDEPGNALFTRRPSMINYDPQQPDSLFISADTLWMYTIAVPDPSKGAKDSLSEGANEATMDMVSDITADTSMEQALAQDSDKLLDMDVMEGADKVEDVASPSAEGLDAPSAEGLDAPSEADSGRDTLAGSVQHITQQRAMQRHSAQRDTTEMARRDSINRVLRGSRDKAHPAEDSTREVGGLELGGGLIAENTMQTGGSLEQSAPTEKPMADSLVMEEPVADSLVMEQPVTDSLAMEQPVADSLAMEQPMADSLMMEQSADTIQLTPKQMRYRAKLERRRLRDTLRAEKLRLRDSLAAIKQAERDSIRHIKDSILRIEIDTIIAKRKARNARIADEEAARMERIKQKAEERKRRKIDKAKARALKRGKSYTGEDYRLDTLADSLVVERDTMAQDSLAIDSMARDSVAIDSLAPQAKPFPADSSYKMIKAYRHVRMYRSDSQMVCDSMVILNTDSVIRLYINPVMWNQKNQIVADSMAIHTTEQRIDKVHFMGDPLMGSEIDTTYYNQVKGKDMTALFENGSLYRNNVDGNAQTIYYMQEEEGSTEVTGLMYIESAAISFYFLDGEIDKIAYKQNPEYVLYPMDMIPETQELRLPDFEWHYDLRPTRDSVFVREVRSSRRDDASVQSKPRFRITERIDYDRRRLVENGEWEDRVDELLPEVVEWRNSRASYQNRE